MVAVFYKNLLSWYLIMKLKESIRLRRIEYLEIPTDAEPSQYPSDQQQDHLVKQQQQLPDSLIKGKEIMEEAKAKSPESNWEIYIRENLKQARQEDRADAWGKLCIYRVPRSLRECDNMAYIPQIVSVGPFHHGKKRLRNMERHKWRALYHILKRTHQNVQLYLDSIKELEEKAVACYEGQIGLNSNEFILMMVLDGSFILELFRGASATEGFIQLGYSRNDPIFAIRGSMHSIQRDMLMLENQLPLFVLDRLYAIQCSQPEQRGKVAKLAIRFFDPLMPTDEPFMETESVRNTTNFDPFSDLDGLHCLEVFRRSLLQARVKPEPHHWIMPWYHSRVADKRRQQLIHRATELSNFGITFEKRNTDRFWDVKFSNGVLEIPRLLIHDGTKSLFLNLVAFEQCHLDSSNEITSYLIFMVNLINSPADVALLHNSGIIEHWLGSDADLANLFNQLCDEVVFDINNSYLSGLSEEVNQYCMHRRHAWRASFSNRYFKNPWTIISVLAAAVLLLLTFIQTFYGVYGYYRPG